MRWALLVALLLVAAPVAAAGKGKAPASKDPKPPAATRFVAAGWCPLVTGEDDDRPRCDVGLGLAVTSWRRTALVAVVGSKTIGAGVAWVVRDGDGPAVALAAGVMARYDGDGVYADEVYPALGVTLNWRPR